MWKLCGCFKTNNNNHKKSNERKYTSFGLFLTGDDESGKTKLVEELVALHDPFGRKDKILKTSEIERYIRDSLTEILRAFEQSHPTIQLEYPENQECINYILTTAHETDFDYPLEFFEHVEMLWGDAGLQTFLEKTNNQRFPDSAIYFLDRVCQIRDPDYIPTTEDMIYSRLFPSQVFKMSFESDREKLRFNLVEMNFLHGEQEKSLQSFRSKSNAIIFIADCSCFNILIDEKQCQTQLHQSLDLYKTIRNNKWLKTTPCILLLNKQDLLAKKIKNGVRLENYFPDFTTYILPNVDTQCINSDKDPAVTRAKSFIEYQFLKVNDNNWHRQFTCDSDICVSLILNHCRELY